MARNVETDSSFLSTAIIKFNLLLQDENELWRSLRLGKVQWWLQSKKNEIDLWSLVLDSETSLIRAQSISWMVSQCPCSLPITRRSLTHSCWCREIYLLIYLIFVSIYLFIHSFFPTFSLFRWGQRNDDAFVRYWNLSRLQKFIVRGSKKRKKEIE